MDVDILGFPAPPSSIPRLCTAMLDVAACAPDPFTDVGDSHDFLLNQIA
jgi:hypothetical protein